MSACRRLDGCRSFSLPHILQASGSDWLRNIRGDEDESATERILFSIASQGDVVADSKETNSTQTEKEEETDS